MAAPTTFPLGHESGAFLSMPDHGFDKDDLVTLFTLANSKRPNKEIWEVAAWNGHEFEILLGDVGVNSKDEIYLTFFEMHDSMHTAESGMFGYYPIDPRITAEDVRGATVAYANETNTGWLFAHCDEDAMIDYEHELSAAIVAQFAPELDAAQVKVNDCLLYTSPSPRDS